MSWMLFPDNAALSALVLALIAIPFLYAARRPVHGLIQSLFQALTHGLRLGARWMARTAEDLRGRNKVVLLAHGREEVQQALDREFQRVSEQIARDLAGYPALQRRLLDEITRVEEDYKKCGEVPPPPPEWTKAVEAIAKIKHTGDGLVQKILEDIANSIGGIYDKVLAEYRQSYESRHKILKGFMPFWRSLEGTLQRVDKNLGGLQESAAKIDGMMDRYEQINKGTEKIEHALTSSATTQFIIAATVLAIAFGGAFVNFWLIARPMSAMIGGGQYIVGGLEASHIAALVVILLETACGLFLMESLRITHLFPRIHNMPDKLRHLILWGALVGLLILAAFEVALAVMRDQIIAADILIKRGLSGEQGAAAAAAADLGWVGKIPVAGQMVLGFILPFLLAFVAIPLEYFIHSARTVFGVGLVLGLRGTGVLMRIVAGTLKHIGNAVTMLYDAVVFLPLIIERAITGRRASSATGTGGGDRTMAAEPTPFRRTGGQGL
jgi:hypothetical protein